MKGQSNVCKSRASMMLGFSSLKIGIAFKVILVFEEIHAECDFDWHSLLL